MDFRPILRSKTIFIVYIRVYIGNGVMLQGTKHFKGGPIAGCLTELRVPRDRAASDKLIVTTKMFQLSGVCLPDTILF